MHKTRTDRLKPDGEVFFHILNIRNELQLLTLLTILAFDLLHNQLPNTQVISGPQLHASEVVLNPGKSKAHPMTSCLYKVSFFSL